MTEFLIQTTSWRICIQVNANGFYSKNSFKMFYLSYIHLTVIIIIIVVLLFYYYYYFTLIQI